MNREKKIIRTSIIGILANVFLAAFKAAAGILSNSIAVVLDAVNNLSDALSSVITIIGTKLASRPADKKHPYGYGRIEYLSATIISVIVLYAGVTSFVESGKKIIYPEAPDYSAVTLIVIAAGVLVKIILGTYVKKIGKEVSSDALINSGEDARLDAVISASTLAAAVIYLLFHVSLDSWLGLIISGVIIKSGIEMLRDTISRILGERIEADFSKELKATICKADGALGAYDLVLHDYGPDRMLGSVHVEVPDYFTADRLDEMTREIEDRVLQEHHVIMTAVGFYSQNTKNDEAAALREQVRDIVMSFDHVLQMHGFYVDQKQKMIRFDVVIDFLADDVQAVYARLVTAVQEALPDYQLQVTLDTDTSD